MDEPRADKVAVVTEVGERFDAAEAAVLTEYRGLNVAAMAELRAALRTAGGTYKIYKNTLVRLAARERGLELDDLLTGPTAIAFVDGDVAGVAKAIRDYARTNPALVVKGGLLGSAVVGADDITALADLPPRDQMLAQIAGLFAAPMQQMASLLDAVPRSFSYALNALIEAGGAPGAPTDAPEADAPAPEASAPEAADETTPAEDSATEAPAADTPDTPPADAGTDTPADAAATEEN
ncbi:MAG TPA: 50S ribosomal protein L10 [Acidimicrobiales bacterium]|nr:50S ribosomal protein L10 [Acidimicrobiales bacterium]